MEEIFPVDSPEYCDFCSFEGNAQAFRLLSKLHFIDSDYGLNLTSAVLNTIVKYPCSSQEKNGEHEDIKYHKMEYFKGDLDYFQKITKKHRDCDEWNGLQASVDVSVGSSG